MGFDDKKVPSRALYLIIVNVSLTGITVMIIFPLLCGNLNRIKCNTSGVARGSPVFVVCDGIFRDFGVATLGCFEAKIGITFSLHAELIGACKNGWHKLSLECDSQLVISAFNSFRIIPWQLIC
jgi:hypothetical protein